MEQIVVAFIGALATVAAASAGGFWIHLRSRTAQQDNATKLLMGLAHDRIIFLGMSYISRGWVTKDEYEDMRQYLYEPYFALGGNGTAERIMHGVERLPIRSVHLVETPIRRTDPTADLDTHILETDYKGEERRGRG